MALMIPTSIEALLSSTAGEKKLFNILRKILSDKTIVRYEMLLGVRDRKPDFVIIDQERGILILEVKDWGIKSITKATKGQFYVQGYHGTSAPKAQWNPDEKCQVYLKEAKEQLIAMPELRDEKGIINVNIDYIIAFPNITKKEFFDKCLDKVINPAHVILSEDISNPVDGFMNLYQVLLPKLLTPLSSRQLQFIDKALFPDITIPKVSSNDGFIPSDLSIVHAELTTIETYQLSQDQEIIAKSLGEGPRLLRGIAGTGKTLIMLYRAKLLAANDPSVRILILCWNTALANYMQQAYERFQFEARGKVVIKHFSAFVRDYLNLYSDPDSDRYSQQFIQSLRKKHIKDADKFTAVYIDEAQDFRKEWIEYIYNNLILGDPKERNLIIAADDAQRIYKQRDFSWSQLGFQMTGRSKVLKKIFRNSARVWFFSASLLKERASYGAEKEITDKLSFADKGGYDPQVIECKDLDYQIEKAIDIIKSLLGKGFAARNVLILYRHKNIPNTGYPLIDKLIKKLEQEKLKYDWIAEDYRAKRSFEWEADTIKISSVHSAKGMDSPVVIILGVETFQNGLSEEDYDELKLMYVAMTRAREFLVLLYSGNNGLVPQIKNCQKEYQKYREAIKYLEKG